MKIAVITGSSSGMGKAISELLLEKGYKVYGVSREEALIQHLNFVSIKADLLDFSSYDSILEKIEESKIDLLINNAGIIIKQAGLSYTDESFEKTFGTNFNAPILLTKTLKSKLDQGLIINISSVSDRLVGEDSAMYCASKAALNKYFETIALEEKGMKLVSILPSYVDTPLLRKLKGDEQFNWNEISKPEEIAELVWKIVNEEINIQSGAKIIAVSNALVEDFEYDEDLWGYNTDTKKIIEL